MVVLSCAGLDLATLQDKPIFKCGMAEPIVAVTPTPCGQFVIGGGASGKAYAWDVTSGELLRVWSAHYKAVSALAVSPCGSFVVSGGEDGAVHAWPFTEYVQRFIRFLNLSNHVGKKAYGSE